MKTLSTHRRVSHNVKMGHSPRGYPWNDSWRWSKAAELAEKKKFEDQNKKA